MSSAGTTFERHDGEQMTAMLESIAELYVQIHSGSPEYDYPMYSRRGFLARTRSQARRPGFEIVTASTDGALVGFSFGYPFPDAEWWANCTPVPDEIRKSSKFAVIELDVLHAHRGKGLGKRLLKELLDGRGEEYATLAAIPGSLAHSMYMRWGWYEVGEFPDPPVMDAMLLHLPA